MLMRARPGPPARGRRRTCDAGATGAILAQARGYVLSEPALSASKMSFTNGFDFQTGSGGT